MMMLLSVHSSLNCHSKTKIKTNVNTNIISVDKSTSAPTKILFFQQKKRIKATTLKILCQTGSD